MKRHERAQNQRRVKQTIKRKTSGIRIGLNGFRLFCHGKTSKYRPTGQFYEISDTIKKPRSFDLGFKTGAADETESEPEESASVTCLSMNFTCWSSENSRYTCQPHIMGEYNKLEVILLTDCENTIQILDQLLNLQG